MALGERIKALRKEAGLSQGELGERIGSDSQRVSRYENGRITPSVDAVVRIAEAFNVSIDYLLVEDAPRRPLHLADLGLASRLADIAEAVGRGPVVAAAHARRPGDQEPTQGAGRRAGVTSWMKSALLGESEYKPPDK